MGSLTTIESTHAIDIACTRCHEGADAPCADLGTDNGTMHGSFHQARVIDATSITRARNAKARINR